MKSRSTVWLPIFFMMLVAVACDKVPLLAPTGSTITVTVSTTTLASNGTAEVIATVTESAGTPVQNGTVVTFTTSLGFVDPREVPTRNGQAVTTFHANGQSGTATITASTGGARSGGSSGGNASPAGPSILVGGAAVETVALRTEPSVVPPTGGTVTLIATVLTATSSPMPLVTVNFTTDAGQLSSSSAVTDANGEARVSLTTSRDAKITARAGTKVAPEFTVRVTVVATVALGLPTTNPIVGLSFTMTVTPTVPAGASPIRSVLIDMGDGTVKTLGALPGATTVSHTYLRADTYVITATVTDTAGQQTVTVGNISPRRANISASVTGPASGQVGTSVQFTASITNAENLPIVSGFVDYGDGTGQSLNTTGSTSVNKIYNRTGNFIVTATYRDQLGGEYRAQTPITIGPAPAFGDVGLDVVSGEATLPNPSCTPANAYPKTCTTDFVGGGVRMVFTATPPSSFTTSVAGYVFTFSDNTPPVTTTSRSVDHVFTSRGTFTITVRVTATNGQTGEQYLTLIVQ